MSLTIDPCAVGNTIDFKLIAEYNVINVKYCLETKLANLNNFTSSDVFHIYIPQNFVHKNSRVILQLPTEFCVGFPLGAVYKVARGEGVVLLLVAYWFNGNRLEMS